jgi:hypothetical protein
VARGSRRRGIRGDRMQPSQGGVQWLRLLPQQGQREVELVRVLEQQLAAAGAAYQRVSEDRVGIPSARHRRGEVPGPPHVVAVGFDDEVDVMRRDGTPGVGAEHIDLREHGQRPLVPVVGEPLQKKLDLLRCLLSFHPVECRIDPSPACASNRSGPVRIEVAHTHPTWCALRALASLAIGAPPRTWGCPALPPGQRAG